MTLGELISELNKLRSKIKDRDPDSVEVVVMNPSARSAHNICQHSFLLKIEAFERYPDPLFDKNNPRSEWHKQIRIVLPNEYAAK